MAEPTPHIDLDEAREIIRREAHAVAHLADCLGDSFARAARLIYECSGAVVLTGVGKAGLIARKISATLASTGTPSHFLHAADAVHGDLGRLRPDDLALVLSHSGQSDEIVRLIALLKQLALRTIAVTGNLDSPLARHADIAISIGHVEEVCPLGLAATASTAVMLALGDALALTVMKMRRFQPEDFARYHPGGDLGRKLITVEQAALFNRDQPLPQAPDDDSLAQALAHAEAKTALRHGCILLTDPAGRLAGLLTDGDLRRALRQLGPRALDAPVAQLMTKNPKTVRPDTLASEALAILHRHRIDEIPVLDSDGRPVGLIDVQDLLALKVVP